MSSILFVCDNDSCSNQLAEAICRRLAPDSWTVACAGPAPAHADPSVAGVLRRNGLELPAAPPKDFETASKTRWDYVVMLGCRDIPPLVSGAKLIHWPVHAPERGTAQAYEDVYEDLSKRIQGLISFIQELAVPA